MILAALRPAALAASAALTLLAACAGQQGAAGRVLADAEATWQALREDAQRFAPRQGAAAEQTLERLRERFAARDYAAVRGALPGVAAELANLHELIETRRAELETAIERARADWGGLSVEVPATLNALQARLDALAQLRQLSAGMDRALLERARTELESIKADWAAALAAFAQGRLPEAADQARESRRRAEQLHAELGGQGG